MADGEVCHVVSWDRDREECDCQGKSAAQSNCVCS